MRKTHNTDNPVFCQNNQLAHHQSSIQPSRMNSNMPRSCCQNLSPIQRLTSWKSKNEDRQFSRLFFLSFSRAPCSVFFFLLIHFCRYSGHLCFNSKRQSCYLLPINVVVPSLHGARPHTTNLPLTHYVRNSPYWRSSCKLQFRRLYQTYFHPTKLKFLSR